MRAKPPRYVFDQVLRRSAALDRKVIPHGGNRSRSTRPKRYKGFTMSGNSARRAAITAATNYKHGEPPLDYKESPAATLFGTNVFSHATMKAQLPKEIFRSEKRSVDTGSALDPRVADVIAAAMKAWALS